QDVVGFLVDDFLRDVALAAHGVDGDDRALDRQHVEQGGNGDDLVRLLVHLRLREYEALARREGRDHVNGILAALAPRPPRGLSVDGDDVERSFGQRADPGYETLPESLGVERGENIAQMVVARRAVGERQKASQK